MTESEKNKGHLTRSERDLIQAGLASGFRLAAIGKSLKRPASTVQREIERNGTPNPTGALKGFEKRNICIHKGTCRHRDLCNKSCLVPCVRCREGICNEVCPDFEAEECLRLKTAPYCCNTCPQRFGLGCPHPQWFYDAAVAHEKAQRRKSESRMGIDCAPEELQRTVEIAKEGLAKGQSIKHIWETHPGETCCSWRTFYDYVEDGIIEIINLDLPKKVRYKQRKRKKKGAGGVPRANLAGRTYEDFEKLPEERKMAAVEMDCVEGRQGKDKKVLLTLLWRRSNFQIMILLPNKNSELVVKALDMVQQLCGDQFEKICPIILTDRGSEFSDTFRIEHGPDGEKRCDVYYCDPSRPDQKPFCERNHEEIRKVLPKGKSNFDALTPMDAAIPASHVNSYAREILGWVAPYDMAKVQLPSDLIDDLGIERIPAEEVLLKPELIPHAIVRKQPGRRSAR